MIYITGVILTVIGILLFVFIIFFHEFGHFIAAKKCGVKVNEFSIGMGPMIFHFKKGETKYSLRLFPIGGYCAMEGEDEDSSGPRAFKSVKTYKQMIIVIAGAVMNIVLGFILMFTLLIQEPVLSSVTVDSFPELSFSANSGLKSGDKILKINGTSIVSSRDISYAVQTTELKTVDGSELKVYKEDCCVELYRTYVEYVNAKYTEYSQIPQKITDTIEEYAEKINASETKEEAYELYKEGFSVLNGEFDITDAEPAQITEKQERQRYCADIVVMRNGEKVELSDVHFYTYKNEDDTIGVAIDFYVEPLEKNFVNLMSQTFKQTVSTVKTIWAGLVGIVQGKFGINDVSGPIGAASAIAQVTSQGLENGFVSGLNNLIFMMMVISVNLGIVNMLPFPALDGGRFLILFIEAVRGKPMPQKYEAYINAAGLIFLLLLMAVISVKDIWMIIRR